MLLGLGTEGTVEERKKAYEVAIAINPSFDSSYANLADILHKEGKSQEAKRVLEYCLEHVNPQCGEVAYTLGSILLKEGDYDKAKKCMETCLEADDTDCQAMSIMAQSFSKQGNAVGEKRWFEKIVATPGAADELMASAYVNLGVLHEGGEKEIDFYRKALAIKPDNFAARYSLGCAYATSEQWNQAVQEFRVALGYGTSSEDEEMRAIKALYQCCMKKIQQDHPQGIASREAMMALFQNLMGTENFNKAAAASKK